MIQGAAGSTHPGLRDEPAVGGLVGRRPAAGDHPVGCRLGVGAAAGPLLGGVLVESTGWQGLFWIDAAIAAACIPLTLAKVEESRDPNRSRSIDSPARS